MKKDLGAPTDSVVRRVTTSINEKGERIHVSLGSVVGKTSLDLPRPMVDGDAIEQTVVTIGANGMVDESIVETTFVPVGSSENMRRLLAEWNEVEDACARAAYTGAWEENARHREVVLVQIERALRVRGSVYAFLCAITAERTRGRSAKTRRRAAK